MLYDMPEVISLRMSDEELAGLDRVRGGEPRSTWVKWLVRAAVLARDEFGGSCDLRVLVVGEESRPGRALNSKPEKLEAARNVVRGQFGGVGSRPPVPKRLK